MSKKNRCYLCGGKLTGGYCRDCGLDNTRLQRVHYHLNESGAARRMEENAGKDSAEEKREKKKEISSKGETDKSSLMKTEKKNTSKGEENTIISGQSVYRLAGTGNSSKHTNHGIKRQTAGKRNRGEGKALTVSFNTKRLVMIVGVIIIIVGVIGNVLSYNEYRVNETVYENNPESSADYDPYEYVERELADTGEEYEAELEPGEYLVGVHLPEGNYTAEIVQGSGYMNVDDYENGIYLWQSFGDDSENGDVTAMEDIRLYEGARLTIDDDIRLRFYTENGQVEDLKSIPNTLTEGFTLKKEQTLTAGEDFEAGVYDLQVSSDWGVFAYQIPTDSEYYEDGVIERSIWLDSEGLESTYRNVVLPEGTKITSQDTDILIVPSENIGTLDYSTYYEYY